jgi:hypothetical protein
MISTKIKGRKDGKSSAHDSLRYGEGLKVDRETGEYLDKSHRTRLGGFGIVDNGIYADHGFEKMAEIIAHAAIEMQANCDMNTKVGADKKIAHFLYSFDQEKPTEAVLRDTEDSTLAVLGLNRNHFATFLHSDNGHWHMHMFVSRIGKSAPHNGNSLWQDKTLRDKVCREVEIRHGLKRDNGLHKINEAGTIVEVPIDERRRLRKEKQDQKPQISDAARKTEIYSGEQTFQSWATSIRLGDRLKHAQTWGDLHAAAAAYACEVKLKGAGFVVCPKDQEGAIQLSKLGLKNLPGRFGAFQPATANPGVVSMEVFRPAPVYKKAGSKFNEWKDARDAFKPLKIDLKNEQRELHRNRRREIIAQHKLELNQVRANNAGQARFTAVSIAKMNHVAELAAVTKQFQLDRKALNVLLVKQGPGNTFRDFLVKQAGAGDDIALALTRQYGADEMTLVLHIEEAQSLHLVASISGQGDEQLRPPIVQHRVERNGTVVFDLGRGCIVTDSAFSKQIQLNDIAASDPAAIATSLRFAVARFGNTLTLTGSAEFQKLAVETAVRNGLNIKFADPALEQYRHELDQTKRARSRGPIDLGHLTTTQLKKGIDRVLRRSLDKGVPPEHVLRAEQYRARAAAARAGRLHELSVGTVDAEGYERGSVLPNPVHGRMGDDETGKDHDVRRAGTGDGGSRSDRDTASPPTSAGAAVEPVKRAGLRTPAARDIASDGTPKLHRDRRGLKGEIPPVASTPLAEPAAATQVLLARAWLESWAAEQNKSARAPIPGNADVPYQVVYVAFGEVVLNLGRAGAVYPKPSDVPLKVGDWVVVDQEAKIQVYKEPEKGKGKSVR